MGTPNAGQQGNARRLLRRIVGRPPGKPPGRVSSAIFLLVFVVGISASALSWQGGPSLSDLAIACVMLGSLLFGPGSAAAYHHRLWGELAGDLMRLGGMVVFFVGLGLLIAEMALTGQWGWVWYSVLALALCVVVAVAGHYYGQDDGPPEGRNPSN